ncbi:MAG: hypothetical protein JWO67_3555 [Streptosporangiaceae bacterium]|nr:hypothetical protein [Streptosporangiaceae bacterium]
MRRLVNATDAALIRLFGRLWRRLDVAEEVLRESRIIESRAQSELFVPAYIAISGIFMMVHFIPIPGPWGLLTYLGFAYAFSLATFHFVAAYNRGLRISLLVRERSGTFATFTILGISVGVFILFSFAAPYPLNYLYR